MTKLRRILFFHGILVTATYVRQQFECEGASDDRRLIGQFSRGRRKLVQARLDDRIDLRRQMGQG